MVLDKNTKDTDLPHYQEGTLSGRSAYAETDRQLMKVIMKRKPIFLGHTMTRQCFQKLSAKTDSN